MYKALKLPFSLGIPKNNDNRVSSQEHLTDEPVFINWLGLLLSFASLWYLKKKMNHNYGTERRLENRTRMKNKGETYTSVHISLTFSRTMLQWRSKALTRPKSFLLLRQLMRTCLGNENKISLKSPITWMQTSTIKTKEAWIASLPECYFLHSSWERTAVQCWTPHPHSWPPIIVRFKQALHRDKQWNMCFKGIQHQKKRIN